jgi:hypothetical protein
MKPGFSSLLDSQIIYTPCIRSLMVDRSKNITLPFLVIQIFIILAMHFSSYQQIYKIAGLPGAAN